MTYLEPRLQHAVAPHFDPEPFAEVAFAELAASPLAVPGICMNPTCSRPFAPTRDWQRYCCTGCRKADLAEMRRVGLKVAPALLAHRMGKYEPAGGDAGLRAVSAAGRRYVGQVQSDWLADRRRRFAEVTG
jgi:hypothetical protein